LFNGFSCSLKRREKDAVHIIYGVDVSINAGNYAYFAPFHYLLSLKDKFSELTILQLARVYGEEMTQIHFG
jgi:geranylgeranyl pyrophosphate synthase